MVKEKSEQLEKLANQPRGLPRFLEAFEEACGQFSGFEIRDDHILVKLAGSCSILVPNSPRTIESVLALKEGDYIGILSEEDSGLIRVRRLP